MKPATHLQLLPTEAPVGARAAGTGLDDDLALRACAGDVSAWSEIYARHYPQLLRQLRHLTGDLAVAEELAQETFA
ncbi:MAG TPA: sigma factor, partial [Nannocystis sp.]